jgi:outer membrane protein assembly factor BamB
VPDGKQLWANPRIVQADTGWGAPTLLGDTMYLAWVGVGGLIIADFSQVDGKADAWKPAERVISVKCNNRRPSGEWLDRWTPASPLIIGDTHYIPDQYGFFYAVDLKSGNTLYSQDLSFDELHTYNAIGVGASAALGGKHIYVQDNQGMCVVLEQGPACKPVAVNRIETVVDRYWPWAPQEILANGPPVFDTNRIYIRGEKYLYCIGER